MCSRNVEPRRVEYLCSLISWNSTEFCYPTIADSHIRFESRDACAVNHGSIWKPVLNSSCEPPSAEIHIDPHLVVQLDPLAACVVDSRVIHQLVQDNRAVEDQAMFE